MENTDSLGDSGAILLTRFTFEQLVSKIIAHFKATHNAERFKDSQLYGFGNYDPEVPNLKEAFETLLKGYVNGKYLYNKKREMASGKPVIKISKAYRNLFFNYLGYRDVYGFLEGEILIADEKRKQLQLLANLSREEDFYYVVYYYGEDGKMTKGQMTIYQNWKTFDLTFVYQNIKNEPVMYNLFGTIKQESNFVHFDAKFFTEGRKIEGSKFIFYVGKSSFYERSILMGTYSSYDKYDHSVSGKLMVVQVDSKSEMEQEATSPDFDPAICQELVRYRHIVPSKLPKKLAELSSLSPYASIYGKVPNAYRASFLVQGNEIELDFDIQRYHYNLVSKSEDVALENEQVSIGSKGQILELHFGITGIFLLQKVSMYLSVYELFNEGHKSSGQFSGIDIHNNIVSGPCTCMRLN